MQTLHQIPLILGGILIAHILSSHSEALNPSEVDTGHISDEAYRPPPPKDKADILLPQEFGQDGIVHEAVRARHHEVHEKDEKEREKWKAKYVVEESGDEGGAEGQETIVEIEEDGDEDGGVPRQDFFYTTRAPRYDLPTRNFAGHPPSSRSSNFLVNLHYFENFFKYYLPIESQVSLECQRDLNALKHGLMHIQQMIEDHDIWPLQMVDSWGKIGDGILDGNYNFIGFFKECLTINVFQEESPKADFYGKYCTITYKPNGNASSPDEYFAHPSMKIPEVSASIQYLPSVYYATCMPSTCTEGELWDSLLKAFNQSKSEVTGVHCQTEDEHHVFTAGEIFGIVFFSLIGIILLSASVIDIWADYYYRDDGIKEGPLKYLLAFSVPENVKRVFLLDTAKNPQVVSCLHGMRFMSICWVLLGHQYSFSASTASNFSELPNMMNNAAFQIVANGDLAVDTFFFMSGLLVCLSAMSQMKKTGKFNLRRHIYHRFIRLLPPIAITCAFLATLSSFLVKGPLSWYYEGYLMKGCRHSWWMDITFISNFMYPYLAQMGKTNEGPSCLPHCWYTSVDMQLYLFTPLILLPMYFWEKIGMILLGFWAVVSVVVPSVITGVYDLWPSSMLIQDPAASLEYNHKAYLMPWCRAGPYIVGIAVGYVLYIAKDSPSITKLSKSQIVVGWLATTAVALSVVFGIAKYNKLKLPDEPPEMSLAASVMYGGFHRAVWGVVIAWITLACHWGYGGPINWILSHPLWQPLSRLTYCIYLTSLPIQLARLSATVRPTYYDNMTKIMESCGILFITIFFSIILTLIAEVPILRLEKIILHPQGAKGPARAVSSRQLTVAIDEKSDGEDCSPSSTSPTASPVRVVTHPA